MTIVPKSGWPVLGQTAVNSGQVISISYSRSGNWFGNVSSVAIGRLLRLAPPSGPALPAPGPPLQNIIRGESTPGGESASRRGSADCGAGAGGPLIPRRGVVSVWNTCV